jgi:membrane protein YdbS with pleckstrin-like domain
MQQKVILQAKPSAIPIILEPILIGLVILITFGGLGLAFRDVQIISLLFIILTVGTITMLILKAILLLISREFSLYTLTETHLFVKRGILERDSDATPINQITDVEVKETVLTRFFNYGNLRIFTAGRLRTLRNLPRPEIWQREILKSARG